MAIKLDWPLTPRYCEDVYQHRDPSQHQDDHLRDLVDAFAVAQLEFCFFCTIRT